MTAFGPVTHALREMGVRVVVARRGSGAIRFERIGIGKSGKPKILRLPTSQSREHDHGGKLPRVDRVLQVYILDLTPDQRRLAERFFGQDWPTVLRLAGVTPEDVDAPPEPDPSPVGRDPFE